jgi:Flp pilus assembly protein TadD
MCRNPGGDIMPIMGKVEDDLLSALEHHRAGRLDVAEAVYRRTLTSHPNHPSALHLLGVLLHQRGQSLAGAELIRRAIAIVPNVPASHNNLGEALRAADQPYAAMEAYLTAIRFRPNYPEAFNNLGNVLGQMNRLPEAVDALRRAISLEPNNPDAHWNLAMALLLLGDFDRGWREFDWRLKLTKSEAPHFPQPWWNGEDLRGQRLLVWGEQGMGDMIQFFRYVPRVHEIARRSGAKVMVAVHPELVSLFSAQNVADEIISAGVLLPDFDVQIPLMSLARVFGTRVESIPGSTPYLTVPENRIRKWSERLRGISTKKVGIAWAGRPSHDNDRRRSIAAALLSPLTKINGITCVTVQPRAASVSLPPGLAVMDLGVELKDFADTARLMSQLDLLITVDTSVAHLAGALARPVWTMLPFAPDWRWMLGRGDSPWYPTMRLFRQPKLADWDGVIREVVAELRNFVAATPASPPLT